MQGTQPVPVAQPLGGLPVGGLLGRSAGAPQGQLPRVDMYTLWNEPNDPTFLRPQAGARSSAEKYTVPFRRVTARTSLSVSVMRALLYDQT